MSAVVVGAPALPASAGQPHGAARHAVSHTPAWTTVARKTTDVPTRQTVSAKVWLAPRDAAGLAALATAVSDPTSAQYHQFITADGYRARFAPTGSELAQVTSWLTGAGLHVTSVGADNHFVAVEGSAAAVQQAFGTRLAEFRVNGGTAQAPTSDVSVPTALSGQVLAVTGLDTLDHRAKPADLGPPPGFVNGTPCSAYYGQKVASTLPAFDGRTQPYAVCGYTPAQLRGADGDSSRHGGGARSRVAIVDAFAAPTILADANTYAARHGDRPFRGRQFTQRNDTNYDPQKVKDCLGNTWFGEETLDVEAVHAMAPRADVIYYGAASCYDDDLLAAEARIVSDDDASIVSNSWGEPTFVVVDGHVVPLIDQTLIDAYDAVFEQGAVQGIGFAFSSGDNGDEQKAAGYTSPDWPAEDAWVTAVGGTTLGVTRDATRGFETGWGTDKYVLSADGTSWRPSGSNPFLYGAGGGFSQLVGRPFYQNGVVPAGTGGRAVPDVAMDADPTTGMLIGETQDFALSSRFGPAGTHYGEFRIGGTSLASPLYAGMQAVAQQASRVRRIGFATPLIYWLARRAPGAFYDVTPVPQQPGNVRADYANGYNADNGMTYSVRTFDDDSSLVTQPGWDDVTGVGSLTGRYLGLLAQRR